MEGCPHCHDVLDTVLPPLRAKYGQQLEIQLIELFSGEEIVALFELAESMGISKEQVGLPELPSRVFATLPRLARKKTRECWLAPLR